MPLTTIPAIGELVRGGHATGRRPGERSSPEALIAAGYGQERAYLSNNLGQRYATLLGLRSAGRPGSGNRLWWTDLGVRALATFRLTSGIPTPARRAAAFAAASRPECPWLTISWAIDNPDDATAWALAKPGVLPDPSRVTAIVQVPKTP